MAKTEKPKAGKKKPTRKKRDPTAKQIKLAKLMVENSGKEGSTKPIGKLMLEAGYSKGTSKTPTKATKSESFQELLDKFIPDDMLAKNHAELMQAATLSSKEFSLKTSRASIKKSIESVTGCKLINISDVSGIRTAYYSVPDNQVRVRAIAEGYKIKNKYAPQKVEVETKGMSIGYLRSMDIEV